MRLNKESSLKPFLFIILGSALIVLACSYLIFKWMRPPVKLGILHSLTGSQALSEKPMIDAELMAIDEINAKSGILGRKIQAVVADGKSDEAIFAQEAQRLLEVEKVDAIIGCWTSASRKAVKPIVEKYDSLLIYPVSYEGIEQSKHILSVGATQNQQIVPCALWSYYNLGKKFFLVGSDYIFSRVANQIIKETLSAVSGQILGEEYILLGSKQVDSMIAKIVAAQPDVIINTIQGESNLSFFQALRAAGIAPEKIPVMSISSVSETEFEHIGSDALAGDYVTASYFQSISREENYSFVANYKARFGANRVLSESTEAGYISVYFWAQAVENAHSSKAELVRSHLYNRVFNAPEGIVYVDNHILNTWKMVYVGKLRADGQFTIVWNSVQQIHPISYPIFGEPKDWDQLINNLYQQWGNRWSNVG